MTITEAVIEEMIRRLPWWQRKLIDLGLIVPPVPRRRWNRGLTP